jgi:hypothetical protein
MGLPDRPAPAVEAVVEALLGPSCRLTWLSGNTAMLGSGLQYMHVDTLALSTEPKTSHVVVNFSCGPYGLANGAMELWQGSHNDPSWDSHRRADDMQLEQHCHEAVVTRCAVVPPIQPEISVCGCLIRDMRAPNSPLRPSAPALTRRVLRVVASWRRQRQRHPSADVRADLRRCGWLERPAPPALAHDVLSKLPRDARGCAVGARGRHRFRR